jgi:DNA polymerase III epsilon subunit-like protein
MDIESIELKHIYKYCTMKHGSNPNEKWYKLSELYEKYYLKKPELALHNALNDVLLCKDVYIYQMLESI